MARVKVIAAARGLERSGPLDSFLHAGASSPNVISSSTARRPIRSSAGNILTETRRDSSPAAQMCEAVMTGDEIRNRAQLHELANVLSVDGPRARGRQREEWLP